MTEVLPQPTTQASNWFVAFGARLRAARESAGLQQVQASERVGLPVRSLRRWESGLADPGVERTMRLAEVYGVSVDWLLGRTAIRACIRPGMVMVDDDAVATLHRLAATGRRLVDLPKELIRHPGIRYANGVPVHASFVAHTEAVQIERRLRVAIERLRRGGGVVGGTSDGEKQTGGGGP